MSNEIRAYDEGRRYDEVKEVVEKIIELQRKEVREELTERFCDNNFLGEFECHNECNTRPIMLYKGCCDTAWECPLNREDSGCNSGHDKTCVFRAERIYGNAVVLRALKRIEHSHGNNDYKYVACDSYITIKFENIAAIRCLKDVYVNLCIH